MGSIRTEQVHLTLTDGRSDKEYQAWLTQQDDGWHVEFAYGRRGSSLKTGRKTSEPVSIDAARSVLEKLVKSKESKGYARDGSGIAYLGTDLAERASGQPVQLLTPVDEEALASLMAADRYVAQEKFDGVRTLIEKSPDGVRAINKRGLYVGVSETIANAVAGLRATTCVIDGESIEGRLFAFDLLEDDGEALGDAPYHDRLQRLEALVGGHSGEALGVVETASGTRDKHQLLERVRAQAGEGIVLKRIDAPHSAGRPNSGGPVRKFKLVETVSAIVTGRNATRRSVAVALLDEAGEQVQVGSVAVPPNQPIPEDGALVEVRYLYATSGNALFQPVYLGQREDITRVECTLKQLKHQGGQARRNGT